MKQILEDARGGSTIRSPPREKSTYELSCFAVWGCREDMRMYGSFASTPCVIHDSQRNTRNAITRVWLLYWLLNEYRPYRGAMEAAETTGAVEGGRLLGRPCWDWEHHARPTLDDTTLRFRSGVEYDTSVHLVGIARPILKRDECVGRLLPPSWLLHAIGGDSSRFFSPGGHQTKLLST